MKSVRNNIGGLGNLLFKEAYIYSQFRKGIIPDIYLQDPEYFDEYRKELQYRFGEGIGSIPFVAVHVRRGDYVNNLLYVDLFEDGYYERAFEMFGKSKKEYLLFSDDYSWCRKQELFKEMIYPLDSSEDDLKDFNYMASCQNHIIANSSFSWWAAYLSPHGGKVIAPKKWYSDGVERTKLPSSWIRI